MKSVTINENYLKSFLLELLNIPSPTGYTDAIVRRVCKELEHLGVEYELTRRGAIRANLAGKQRSPDRAIVTHLDTLGAMVKEKKENGRLAIVPVGHWSSRFAEGARVRIFTDSTVYRGTILPLMASGHTFNEMIDKQPVSWEQVEVRIDEAIESKEGLNEIGVEIGDFIAIDTNPEILANGYINSRHLDNKAGVALVMATVEAIVKDRVQLPVDCHILFTISEETGSGASAVLHGDVAEMVTIDNGTQAQGQNSSEFGATIAMADSTGPFDYHLTHFLIDLCKENNISYQRDIFKYYRCDSASAVEAGNDTRTALVAFGLDSSHGYERTNIDSLMSVSRLLSIYMQKERPLFHAESQQLRDSLKSFPKTKTVKLPQIEYSNQSSTEELQY